MNRSDRYRTRLSIPVPSLTRWGVSPDADLVYRLLVTTGPGTVGSTAASLGITRHRVATALDELLVATAVRAAGPAVSGSVARGPAASGPTAGGAAVSGSALGGRPAVGGSAVGGWAARRWEAVPVDRVLAVLRRRRARTVDLRHQAGFHHALLKGLGLPGPTPPPAAHGRILLSPAEIRARIATLVGVERHEHLAVNPEPTFRPDVAEAALPLDRMLLARGVRVRTCGVPPPDGDRSCAAVQHLASLGAEYRERTEVPVKLMVFDRRIALLPADPLDLSAGALEIDHPVVVAGLVALFEQLWTAGRDPRRTGVAPITLTVRERQILTLLAGGLTDAVVADRLRISRRTIAYTLRALMDRVGVENRFQLGLTLGSMHLLTPSGRSAGPDTGEQP